MLSCQPLPVGMLLLLLGYALMVAPPGRKLMGAPITEVGFHVQEGSDVAAVAAAIGLAPELPTEISGIDSLAFFEAEDAQCFAKMIVGRNSCRHENGCWIY